MATMATQRDIDDEMARMMTQADALMHAARYELDRVDTLFKSAKLDRRTIDANLSPADHNDIQRRVAEGRRQIEADVAAARLNMELDTLGRNAQTRKSRVARNMV